MEIHLSILDEIHIFAQIHDGWIHLEFPCLFVKDACFVSCVNFTRLHFPHVLADDKAMWSAFGKKSVRWVSRMDLKVLIHVDTHFQLQPRFIKEGSRYLLR